LVRRRKLSAIELTEHMLERIETFNPRLNAIVNLLAEDARAAARLADVAQARGEDLGPLHGVPIVIKDHFEIAGVPTTAGIAQLKDNRPPVDSEVVRRLRAAGAIVLGNTNVPFLLNDWQTFNPLYGTTNNPWDLTRTPGGSSGGSAAALAAGLAYFSAGSDRAGSLRVPAHFCGIYAHKPSLNIIPLRGFFPSAPGGPPPLPEVITVPGPMGRSAADLRVGMNVMAGPDGTEALAYRWSMPAPRRTRLRDYRVGFVLEDPACPVDAPVRKCMEDTIAALRAEGVTLREGWPSGIDPKAQYQTYLYLLMSANPYLPPGMKEEALKPLAALNDGSMGSVWAQSYLDPHRRFLDYARQQLAARAAWTAAFGDVDVFLMPSAFVAAFPHNQEVSQDQRKLATAAGERRYHDIFYWSVFASLAGIPSTAAPVGRTPEGLPVGIQIMGPHLEDATPIDFAERLADVLGGFAPPPSFT
jgi:amidase